MTFFIQDLNDFLALMCFLQNRFLLKKISYMPFFNVFLMAFLTFNFFKI